MSTHVRGQIRDYVRARLQGIPGLEQSVEIDSAKIPDDLRLPWVHVLLGNENILQRGLGAGTGRKNLRELELTIDIYSKAVHEATLIAENFAALIEARLASDPRMGRLVQDLALRSYSIEHSDEGQQPIARLRMQWFVTYFTNERDATAPA